MESLEIAIKMEMEGKEFYENASEKSSDNLGKSLFLRLSMEEDSHATKAREIANSLNQGGKPLAIEESFDSGEKLNSIFAKAKGEIEPKREVASNEFDVIQIALDMEEKTQNFYENQSDTAKTEFERRFYTALKREESGHYLALVDYREYLIDPTSWFTKSEHISLDGG
ncbi:MAG: ferritin family protein [Chloroflexi bacterium]|nr:ferritin family protein [Chloroflexota bacterium]